MLDAGLQLASGFPLIAHLTLDSYHQLGHWFLGPSPDLTRSPAHSQSHTCTPTAAKTTKNLSSLSFLVVTVYQKPLLPAKVLLLLPMKCPLVLQFPFPSQIQQLCLNGLDWEKRQGGEPHQHLNFIVLLTRPGVCMCTCNVCVFVIYQPTDGDGLANSHGMSSLGRTWMSAWSRERGGPWMGSPSCRGSGGALPSRPNLEVQY